MTQARSIFCTLLLACPALHAVEQKELPTELETIKLIIIHDQATIKALAARAANPETAQEVGQTYILEQLAKLEKEEISPSLKASIPVYKKILTSPEKRESLRDLEDEAYIFYILLSSAYDNVLFKIDHLTPMYESSNEEAQAALERIQTTHDKELELLNDPVVQDFLLRIIKVAGKKFSMPTLDADSEIAKELLPHLASLPAPLAQGFKQYLNRPAEGKALFEACKEKRGKLDDNELLAIYMMQDALSAASKLKSAKAREKREH